ncbi:esterase/lipase family protein [Streptomyces longwoodensis]|uniref:esterase/lipase family protein n=1 Tax=Streptomyces longwoodensis TaxID=68231 RepID=UPI0033D9E123
MLVHPLPIVTFLRSLLSAAGSCGYIGAVVLLARARDAQAQHHELAEGWSSVHDVTGPALAVLCPVPPDAWSRGVRNPTKPEAVSANGMMLEVPYMQERFDEQFWNHLSFEHGWDDPFVRPERPAPAEVHTSGWTRTVTDAADFFGIEESHIPCIVLLSMSERHGTVIPIDESFGVYEFLKKLMERVGSAPVRLGKLLEERERLRRHIGVQHLGLDSAQVRSLDRKLAQAQVLAPELIAGCRTRLGNLETTEPSDEDLQALREVSALLRSPQRQAERHNLRIGGLLSQLERTISMLEAQRPNWERVSQSQKSLAAIEHDVTRLRDEVVSIRLAALVREVATELPHPLHAVEAGPVLRLPGWSLSRLARRSPHTYTPWTTAARERVGRLGLVMVHGILSKPDMWNDLQELLAEDTDLGFVDPLPFGYRTGLFRLNPTRVFPGINVVADSLKEYLATEAEGYERLVLLAHSQGGLVVQRYLTRMLTEGRGEELSRIRRVVLLACPNNGAEILLSLRRGMLGRRHPQEHQLRPLNEEVTNTRRTLMRDVIHAGVVTERTCPIPFSVYAGESDNIVPAASAQSDYPDAAALPGDHSTIARPTSRQHRTYTTLRRLLLAEGFQQVR